MFFTAALNTGASVQLIHCIECSQYNIDTLPLTHPALSQRYNVLFIAEVKTAFGTGVGIQIRQIFQSLTFRAKGKRNVIYLLKTFSGDC